MEAAPPRRPSVTCPNKKPNSDTINKTNAETKAAFANAGFSEENILGNYDNLKLYKNWASKEIVNAEKMHLFEEWTAQQLAKFSAEEAQIGKNPTDLDAKLVFQVRRQIFFQEVTLAQAKSNSCALTETPAHKRYIGGLRDEFLALLTENNTETCLDPERKIGEGLRHRHGLASLACSLSSDPGTIQTLQTYLRDRDQNDYQSLSAWISSDDFKDTQIYRSIVADKASSIIDDGVVYGSVSSSAGSTHPATTGTSNVANIQISRHSKSYTAILDNALSGFAGLGDKRLTK